MAHLHLPASVLTDKALPAFEEALDLENTAKPLQEMERAFALLGRVSSREILVEEVARVPEEYTEEGLKGIPRAYEEKIRGDYEFIGYLHSHPGFHHLERALNIKLSEGDFGRMVERNHLVWGVCVLPLQDLETGQGHAVMAFWHREYPIPIPVEMGIGNEKKNTVVCHREPDGDWCIIPLNRKKSSDSTD